MPKIPRKFAQRTITGQAPVAAPGEFERAGQAVAGQFEAIGRAGEIAQAFGTEIAKAQQKEQDEKDFIYLNDATTGFRQAWGPEVVRIKSLAGKDAEGTRLQIEAFYEKLSKPLIEGSRDNRTRSMLQAQLFRIADTDILSIDAHERTERKKSGIAGDEANHVSILQDVGNNPYKIDEAIKGVDVPIDALVALGVYTTDEANKIKLERKEEIANASIMGRMKKSPRMVHQELIDGKYDKFFDSTEKLALIEKAEGYIEESLRKEDKAEKELDKITKKAQEENTYELLLGIGEGTVDMNTIRAAGEGRAINRTQFDNLRNELIAPKEVSDSNALIDIQERIIENDIETVDEILNHPLLKTSDKITLSNRWNTAQDKTFKREIRAISDSLKPRFISTGPLSQWVKSDEQVLFAEIMQIATDMLEQNKPVDEIIKTLSRHSRIDLDETSLPKLRFGTPDTLSFAEAELVTALINGVLSPEEGEIEAELIERYRRLQERRNSLKGGGIK